MRNKGHAKRTIPHTTISALARGACACVLLVFTFFIFGPIELFITNYDSLRHETSQILPVIFVESAVLFLLLSGIILAAGKYRDTVSSFIFSLGLCVYLQGNFMQIDYGILDGSDVNWSQYIPWGVANTAIWLAIIALPQVLLRRKKEIMDKLLMFVSLVVVSVQVVTLVVLLLTSPNATRKNSSSYFSTDGMLELSQNKNIIVFVLDAFDRSYMNTLLEDYPECKDILKDFTYYDNTLGMFPTTTGAMPHILSGIPYKNETLYNDYISRMYQDAEIYGMLSKNNYDVKIYTTSNFSVPSAAPFVDNIHLGRPGIKSYRDFSVLLFKFTAVRYFPHFLKQTVWFYTDDFESVSVDDVYWPDDVKYYETLMDQGITLKSKNAFRLYHFRGAHGPYIYNADLTPVAEGEKGDVYSQSRGALNVVAEYLDQLRQKGIYDDSTVVLMADHGHGEGDMNQSPILLVKNWGESKEFAISSDPVSYADLHAYLSSLLTNGTFDAVKETVAAGQPRTYLYHQNAWDNGYLPPIYEYILPAEANDANSMVRSGNIFEKGGVFTLDDLAYTLGEPIVMDDPNSQPLYFLDSLTEPTESGSFTVLSSADAKFRLNRDPVGNLKLDMEFGVYEGVYNYQRMALYVNGALCGEKAFLKDDTSASFVIPNDLLNGTSLTLRFEFPNAVSPVDRSILWHGTAGSTTDTREMAFQLKRITLSETDEQPDANQSGYLGSDIGDTMEIKFSSTGNGRQCQLSGWSSPEGEMTWTEKSAALSFTAEQAPGSAVQLQFRYSNYAASGETTVSLNGKEIGTLPLSTGINTYALTVPPDLMSKTGTQKLTFLTPGATSPSLAGNGADTRVLGLYLETVELMRVSIQTEGETQS